MRRFPLFPTIPRNLTHIGRIPMLLAILTAMAAGTALGHEAHPPIPNPNLTSPDILRVRYHERPPYLFSTPTGIRGSMAEEVHDIMHRAKVPFVWIPAPPKRQLKLLKQNDGRDCMVGWFKTPDRETFAVFSRTFHQDRPLVALARRNDTRLMPGMRLSTLLGDPALTLLVKGGYSYGHCLDQLMERFSPNTMSTTSMNTSMIRMIHAGRADYMLLSPDEVDGAIAATELPPSDFTTVEVTDMPPGNKRYLLFTPMTDNATIARINQAIRDLFPQIQDD